LSTEGDWRGPSDQQPFVCRCDAHFGRKTVRLRVPIKHLHTVTGSPRRWDCMTLRAQYPAEKSSLDASSSQSDGLRDLPRRIVGGAGRASDLRRKPQAYGCYKKEAILVLSASPCCRASPVSLPPPPPPRSPAKLGPCHGLPLPRPLCLSLHQRSRLRARLCPPHLTPHSPRRVPPTPPPSAPATAPPSCRDGPDEAEGTAVYWRQGAGSSGAGCRAAGDQGR